MPATVLVVVTAAFFSQGEALRPPDRPDKPFRLFVFSEPRGESEAVAQVGKAEEECHRILKRRKDWFVEVDDREQAEIVMEIKAYWMDEQTSSGFGVESGYGAGMSVTRYHYLMADVTIVDGQFGLRVDDRRSVKGAASKLLDALRDFCKKNYWQIERRRNNNPKVLMHQPRNERLEWTWPSWSATEFR
jgi:hypothetical protein